MGVLSFIPIIGKVIDKIFPDTQAADAAKLELMKLQQKGELDSMLGQLEINKEQARHPSIFIAGARPAAMWVCILVLAIGAVGKVIIPTILALLPLFGSFDLSTLHEASAMLSSIDMEFYITALMGMLGLGTMRSYDKTKGIDTRKIAIK